MTSTPLAGPTRRLEPPAAVNGWARTRWTTHADLYDNLYVVLKGTKEFTLLPPQRPTGWTVPVTVRHLR